MAITQIRQMGEYHDELNRALYQLASANLLFVWLFVLPDL